MTANKYHPTSRRCAQNAAAAQAHLMQQRVCLESSLKQFMRRPPPPPWKPRARQVAGKLWVLTWEGKMAPPRKVTAMSLEMAYAAYESWTVDNRAIPV